MDNIKIVKLAGKKNWTVWKFQMSLVFKNKDLTDIVNGNEPEPEFQKGISESEEDAVVRHQCLLKEWRSDDTEAQKLIMSSIEDDPLLYIANCTTSKQMMDKLESVYGEVHIRAQDSKSSRMGSTTSIKEEGTNIES